MTLLNVPFSEKDQAKRLGARWNPSEKKWYVPEELSEQLGQFRQWLIQDDTRAINDEQVTSLTPNLPQSNAGMELDYFQQQAEPLRGELLTTENKGLSLTTYMGRVQDAVRHAMAGAVWVHAEIANIRDSRGHLYFELTEMNSQGQAIATCRAMIWQRQAEFITEKFQRETGIPLATGQKILLLAEATFHAKFGFSLSIQDIDPAFTLGELELNLNNIRKQLIQEQSYQLNKRFKSPFDFFNVAVIAPPDAAGLGDFRADADLIQFQGLCHFKYFYSTFQGEKVESELLSAIDAFMSIHRAQPFDALVIIRGGGAKLDLNPLNNYLIASRLANAPLPVFTGIGHERDSTILDEVSHTKFDTPSKVISAIRHQIFSQAQTAKNNWNQIEKLSRLYVRQQQHALSLLDQKVQQNSVSQLRYWQDQLSVMHLSILQKSQLQLNTKTHAIFQQFSTIKQLAKRKTMLETQRCANLHQSIQANKMKPMTRARERVKQWIGFILSSGPQTQLKRGFVIAKNKDGLPITSANEANKHSTLTLSFKDGDMNVQVLKGE